ncbi:response regulator transcription factor [Effusibacillus lacus]|uniref:DNA-binding response regulator n=1 Tax=Effusibacillus lacus TaxID=1348429 RepID=A0A292YKK1_9BACL|nr:response regulator transcription factor [Effusibacillus lacus]TCS74968.1 DNA-binding response OmpR family regulator [Effusibacillus lacus]GAX91637.1 DNA-binding response regulator [Effusibacillus lacus]
MVNAKILVVDDEPDILNVLQAYLEKNGYVVYAAESGMSGLQMFDMLKPDLIVLDLMLPDISGEEICRTIRRKSDVPILMLTAKSNEDDKVNGLLIGADDYVTKPFSPRELTARIISLLRRSHVNDIQEPTILRFHNNRLLIDLERHEVLLNNEQVSLTPLEFKLLVTLAKHPKRVFSRMELINLIQGYTYEGYERTVDVHIKNLRHKIGDDPRNPLFIGTVFGVGYKFQVAADE